MSKNEMQLDIADNRSTRMTWWSHVKLPGKPNSYANVDPHKVARDLKNARSARGKGEYLGQN